MRILRPLSPGISARTAPVGDRIGDTGGSVRAVSRAASVYVDPRLCVRRASCCSAAARPRWCLTIDTADTVRALDAAFRRADDVRRAELPGGVDVKPKMLVLFAGGGGSTWGAHLAGFDTLGVEWDGPAVAVHEAHAGPCIRADLRDVSAWLPAVLAWLDGAPLWVWASPPCQDWSAAGKRLGATGERNGWPWTWDAIDALRAAGVEVVSIVTENVGGMLHHLSRAGCGAGAQPNPYACPGCYWSGVVVPELAQRFQVVRWRVLDAVDYGVPQHRKRLILVGGPHAYRWPAQTHHPIGGVLTPWWRTIGGELGPRPEPCADCGDIGIDCSSCEPIGTVCQCGPTSSGCRGRWIGGGTNPAPSRGLFERTERDITDEPSTTVPAYPGGNAVPVLVCDDGVRRQLTPEQGAILQGWPEVVRQLPDDKREAYRIVGNAVPPPLAEALCRALVSL